MAVTRDATSGWYVPASAAEWTALLAGTGIPNPTSLHLLQEASGNLADSIGSQPLDGLNGTAFAYQQTVAGWSRKAITSTNGARYSAASGSDTVQSRSGLVIGQITGSAPATTNAEIVWASYGAKVGTLLTSGVLMCTDGTPNTVTGASTPAGAIRPWFAVYDNAAVQHYGATDTETTAAGTASTTGGMYQVIGNDDGATGVSTVLLYHADWLGTALTPAQISVLIPLLKFGPVTSIGVSARRLPGPPWVKPNQFRRTMPSATTPASFYNETAALAFTEAVAVAASHKTANRAAALADTELVSVAASHKTVTRSAALADTELVTLAASHKTTNRAATLAWAEAVAVAASHITANRALALTWTELCSVAYSVAYRPGPKPSWYQSWYGQRGHVFTDGWWGLTPDGSTNKAVGRLVSLLLAPDTYRSTLGGETYESALVSLETLLSTLGD